MAEIFWWVIFPYIAFAILILGSFYRYAFRGISWYAPSTEIFEKRWLRIGSTFFHWGIIFAFIGHVMGILIPRSFYLAIGVSDHLYHLFAILGGAIPGLMVVFGLLVMLVRKLSIPAVQAHTTFGEYYTIILLLLVAGIGTYMTIIFNTTVVAYEYRATIGPWFRSLFVFQPQYQLMGDVPFIFRLHVVLSFLLFASIPFTQLIHMFSFPGRFPFRAPQQYRARDGYKNSRP